MHTFREVAIWRVSSWSAGGNCIEIANRKSVIQCAIPRTVAEDCFLFRLSHGKISLGQSSG